MSARSKSNSAIGDLLDDLLPAPAGATAHQPVEPGPAAAPAVVEALAAPAQLEAKEAPVPPPAFDKESRRPAAPPRRPAPAAPPSMSPPATAELERPADTSPMVTTTIRIRADLLERLRDYSAFSSIPISKILATGATEVLDEMARRYRARGIQVPTRQALTDEDLVAPKTRAR